MVALAKKLIILQKFIWIIFLCILFPLGEVARIQLGSIAINAFDIGIFFIVLFYWYLLFKKDSYKHPLVKPFLLFLFVCLVSLLGNSFSYSLVSIGIAFLYCIRLFAIFGTGFIIYNLSPQIKKTILISCIVGGFIMLVLGYLQFIFYPYLRNLYYLGWDPHLYRMFGTMLDPNFFGAFLVFYFLFLSSFLLFFIKKREKLQIILLSCLLLFTSVAIFLTYSRSAYLIFLVGIFIFGFLAGNKKIFYYAFIVICVISVLVFSLIHNKSEGTNLLRTTSSFARIGNANNALFIFSKSPIWGVGFDAYRYAQEKYGLLKENAQVTHSGAGADNSFLFVLATTGVIGLGSYLYLWYKIIRLEIKNKNIFCSVVIASVIALFIDSLFENSLFYPFLLLWVLLLTGFMDYTLL